LAYLRRDSSQARAVRRAVGSIDQVASLQLGHNGSDFGGNGVHVSGIGQ
jgi:hypothetical protein